MIVSVDEMTASGSTVPIVLDVMAGTSTFGWMSIQTDSFDDLMKEIEDWEHKEEIRYRMRKCGRTRQGRRCNNGTPSIGPKRRRRMALYGSQAGIEPVCRG